MLACLLAHLRCGAARCAAARRSTCVCACLRACVRCGAARCGTMRACVRDCELNGAGSRVPCAFRVPCQSFPAAFRGNDPLRGRAPRIAFRLRSGTRLPVSAFRRPAKIASVRACVRAC
eukprot:3192836-Alexandrium_andersonii.AAC.1